jgi:virulence-associated protein VapD
MKETELFVTNNQISYDLTINTIQRMFNDEIKHCYNDIDSNIAKHLEGFRDDFLSLFQHAYKDEEYKNNQQSESLHK